MSSTPRFIPTALQPTAEQLAIQTAHDRVILVEANAGAAKTTTLALRIGETLARGLPPSAILALVFTPEAREVMRQRLLDVGIAPALAAAVRIDTVDSFAEAVLQDYEGLATPSITAAKALRGYVLQAIERVSAKYQDRYSGLEIATHNLAISQFLDAQLGIKARLALPAEADELGHEETAEAMGVPLTQLLTFLEYEELRLGAFDEAHFRGPFDATYDLARYLEARPDIANALPAYRTVVCDELHDINEASFRILLALLDKGQSFFVGAGDKDQVIHATLGADAQYLRERFDRQFPALRRLPLATTFRHGPQLALAIGRFKAKPSQSGLSSDTAIERRSYPVGDWQQAAELAVAAIGEWAKECKKEGATASDCAILIRDSHQSIAIENALLQAGIGYRCHGLVPYLQREEILFMRGMLAIALGDLASVPSKEIRKAIVEALVVFGEIDLHKELYLPGVGKASSQQEALAWAQKTIADDPDNLQSFFTGLISGKSSGENRGKYSPARQRIVATVDYLLGLPANAPATAALREVWARMGLEAKIKHLYVHPQEAEVVMRSVLGFIDLPSRTQLGLQAFSAWLGGNQASVAKRQGKNQVTLELVATAKGKEYGHVILPFLESGEFPRRKAVAADEANLFYVGATRAKARLTLLLPDQPEHQSVFVDRLGLGAALAAKATAACEKNSDSATLASTAPQRTDLNVSYAAKDQAKALGARWDPVRKTWYVDAGADLAPFKGWIK